MNNTAKKLLMPIFRLIARPGLGNPHTPFEDELLLGGAKPCAIMSKEDLNDKLKKAINEGELLLIGEKEIIKTCELYYRPEEEENAQKAASIFQQFWKREGLSHEDAEFLNDFFLPSKERSLTEQFNENLNHILIPDNYYHISGPEKNEQNVNALLSGDKKALIPFPTWNNTRILHPKIKTALKEGQIKSLDVNETRNLVVLAQKDKLEEGKELFARVYEDDKGYEPLSIKDHHKRIGQLLGYTENDIKYHGAPMPFLEWINSKTGNFRKTARKEIMLHDAANKNTP
jgi:hypothetical protein